MLQEFNNRLVISKNKTVQTEFLNKYNEQSNLQVSIDTSIIEYLSTPIDGHLYWSETIDYV